VLWPVDRSYPTLFVPASVVTTDQQHTFVIRVRDNKTEWVTAQTGQLAEGEIEVFGELNAGDQVSRTRRTQSIQGINYKIQLLSLGAEVRFGTNLGTITHSRAYPAFRSKQDLLDTAVNVRIGIHTIKVVGSNPPGGGSRSC